MKNIRAEDDIASQDVMKFDTAGRITGHGAYNTTDNGTFVFLYDTLALATPGKPNVFPFIISEVNGETVIALNAKTIIPDGHLTNAMIAGLISSDDYSPGSEGWGIHKDGLAEFNAITARGDIEASSLTSNIIEARHIKGGGVSSMSSASGSLASVNTPLNTFTSAINMGTGIPVGMTGSVMLMVNYQGGAASGVTMGCKIYRVRNGQAAELRYGEMSVSGGTTSSGATSVTANNLRSGDTLRVSISSRGTGALSNVVVNANRLTTLL